MKDQHCFVRLFRIEHSGMLHTYINKDLENRKWVAVAGIDCCLAYNACSGVTVNTADRRYADAAAAAAARNKRFVGRT